MHNAIFFMIAWVCVLQTSLVMTGLMLHRYGGGLHSLLLRRAGTLKLRMGSGE
jgi:hypothetical protein